MQEKNEFLNRVNARNEKNIFTLMRNWNYVLAKAMPFHTAKMKAGKTVDNPKMKAKKQGDQGNSQVFNKNCRSRDGGRLA
ncbi:MAG: hypothetical protein AB2L14_03735 [Candidatus Xenobiia bacterium LiM19]